MDGDPLVVFADPLFRINERYLTVDLPAGVHTFALGDRRKPRKGSDATLNLVAGQRYYV